MCLRIESKQLKFPLKKENGNWMNTETQNTSNFMLVSTSLSQNWPKHCQNYKSVKQCPAGWCSTQVNKDAEILFRGNNYKLIIDWRAGLACLMLIGHNGSESSAKGSTVEPPRLRGSVSLSLSDLECRLKLLRATQTSQHPQADWIKSGSRGKLGQLWEMESGSIRKQPALFWN